MLAATHTPEEVYNIALARGHAIYCRRDVARVAMALRMEFSGQDHPLGREVERISESLVRRCTRLIRAGRRILKAGPKYVAIKKGEHGALLFGENEFFSCGAYPLEDIHDPTGAGDTFAGGMAGYLAARGGELNFSAFRRAMIYGSVLASFNVEAFSMNRLRTLKPEEIEGRYQVFRAMSSFEAAA